MSPLWIRLASLLCWRVDDLPIRFHIDNRPAFRLCFVETFVESADTGLAIIGPFALGIGMVNIERESWAVSGGGPLEHLQVAVRIAKCRYGATADV